MEVVTMMLERAVHRTLPEPMGALSCAFRDGSEDSVLLTEDQLQRIALTVIGASRTGTMPTYEQLESPKGLKRAEEFLRRRETLRSPDFEKWERYVASAVRPFFQGGGVIFPAARRDGSLFIAVFDAFSAHALVEAAATTFK